MTKCHPHPRHSDHGGEFETLRYEPPRQHQPKDEKNRKHFQRYHIDTHRGQDFFGVSSREYYLDGRSPNQLGSLGFAALHLSHHPHVEEEVGPPCAS